MAALVGVLTAGCVVPRAQSADAGPAVISGAKVGFAQASVPLWESPADLAADFDAIRSTGAQWVRFDFPWSVVQGGGPNSWNWAPIDRAVAAANARGLHVLGILAFTPGWAAPAGATDDKWQPTDNAAFANYARAAAARYAPQGVHAYEIWNEPNIQPFWKPAPNVAAYTDLLRQAYAAIKSVDPASTVVTGGSSPAGGALGSTFVSPAAWLNGIYDNGGQGSFDAVGHHPYSGLPYGPATVASWNPFQQTADLHNIMAAHGDGAKQVWGTEAGTFTGSAGNAQSEATQSAWVTQYLQGWTRWSFVGPFFYYSLRDIGTNPADKEQNFGIIRINRVPKAAWSVFASDVG